LLEPIFVGDLARAIANILERDGAGDNVSGKIMELAGPEKMTMRAFVEVMAKSMHVSKPMVNMPPGVAALAAGFLSLVQEVPLLSSDQVKLAQEDMVCSVLNDLPGLLAPAAPTTLQAALNSYQSK